MLSVGGSCDHGASPEGMQKEVSRFYAELAAY